MGTKLMNEFATLLAGAIEKCIYKSRFTHVGVLVVDKIVRSIINALIDRGGSDIRTMFSKISGTVTVLFCNNVRV